MTTTPGNYQFTIYQGATFQELLTLRDSSDALVDLTGKSAKLQIKKTYNSDTALVTISSTTSGIYLGGVLGTVQLTISATSTASLVAGEYFYDLILINGSVVDRILEGKIKVVPSITEV